MMNEEQTLIDRYLHGELDDAEQESLEERFFVDDDLFEQIEVAEMRLIDNYVRGEMDGAAKARFESGYLTTLERSSKVAKASVFHRELARLKPKKESWFARFMEGFSFSLSVPQMATVATILLLAIGAFWVFRVLQSDLPDVAEGNVIGVNLPDQTESPTKNVANGTNMPEIPRNGPSPSGNRKPRTDNESQKTPTLSNGKPIFATLFLPGRSGVGPRGTAVHLLQDTSELNLKVVVPGLIPADSYSISVFASDGSRIWSADGVSAKRSGRSLTIAAQVPAEILEEDTYKVQVKTGDKPDGLAWNYILKIVR